ncbi:MAG: bacillithiol biosynthesis cysteine-adding enzyme BshC [candidate division Zixibacteria bacterium]|nr:bacillithiol biosynthesis cysteine-adding enzyme BshC [candidate division Zixibacteria bacterium]
MHTATTMNLKINENGVSRKKSIDPCREIRYNQLYLDFVDSKPEAMSFYPGQNAAMVAEQLSEIEFSRSEIVSILRRQNKEYGSKSLADANIAALENSETLVAFAGQQAGLFGGPLMSLIKAVWVVKEAKRLSLELNRRVVPIFWIAADDHDFAEINHTYFFNSAGEPNKISFNNNDQPGRPAYQRFFSDRSRVDELRKTLSEALGATDFTEEVIERLFAAYREGDDFALCFGRWLADTLPDIGLIIFSPGDDEVKRLSKPFYSKIIESHNSLKRLLKQTNKNLVDAGYHNQVEKSDSATHLFILNPERTPLHVHGDKFELGERDLSNEEVTRIINEEPERLSPDVLTRPLLSAFLFPTILQGGGSSEVAYFAQLAGLYEFIERPVPRFDGRASATLVEKRFERLMSRHKLELCDFTGDFENTVSAVLRRTFPDNIELSFSKAKSEMNAAFDELAGDMLSFDKTLEKNSEQIWGKIDFALGNFEKKVFAAHKRKMADERAALYRAANSLFPLMNLQERSISSVYYLSRYGYKLIDFIIANLECDNKNHQLLYLSDLDK